MWGREALYLKRGGRYAAARVSGGTLRESQAALPMY
jgi:hypothetical protein